MASNNNTTRIDVQVNTEAAKNKLRELADEARRSNINANRLDENVTGGNIGDSAEEAKRISKEIERERKAQIADEHRELRRRNREEYEERRRLHRTGKIGDDDLEEDRRRYSEAQMSSYIEERSEKRQVEEDQLQKLQEILDALRTAHRDETIDDQRDSSEFSSGSTGILSGLFERRKRLQQQRLEAESESDINNASHQIRAIDKRINKYLGGGNNFITGGIQTGTDLTQNLMSGNIMGAGAGLLSKLGPYGVAAAGILTTVGGGAMLGSSATSGMAPLYSLRAQGNQEQISNEQRAMGGDFHNMGQANSDVWQRRYDLQMSSGIGERGSSQYALESFGLEKGYGIQNVPGLSTFERADKYAKSTNDNIMEMLNVMVQIRDGSIKPNDLTLANEKAQLMYRMQASQSTRREQIDNKQILDAMAAFEMLGGSGKDWRAGDFIEGAYSGIREGGDQNMMLLKTQAAAESFPELAGNPVELAKIVEKGDDPRYLAGSLKMLRRITQGDQVSQYYLMKKLFPNLSVEQREKLLQMADNPEALAQLQGSNRNNISSIFSTPDALQYATENTPFSDQAMAALKDFFQNIVIDIQSWIKSNNIGVNVKDIDLGTIGKFLISPVGGAASMIMKNVVPGKTK